MMRLLVRFLALVGLITLCLSHNAEANWLTRLLKEAGDTAGSAAHKATGTLEEAAGAIKRLPEAVRTTALAADITPDGHWTFINRSAERLTVATPNEMKRMGEILTNPSANDPSGRTLTLLLTPQTVFTHAARLIELPDGARLRITVGDVSFPIMQNVKGVQWAAEIRSGVLLGLTTEASLREAVFHLMRQLRRADIRLIALEPRGPAGLLRLPRVDPVTGQALTDRLAPSRLASELDSLRGQTAIVTGRVANDRLTFRRSSGSEDAIDLGALRDAAARNDVSLVILDAMAPRQPGTRNWLWRRVGVPGLNDALNQATFADILSALSARSGRLMIETSPVVNNRIVLRARAIKDGLFVTPDAISRGLAEIVSEVAGNIVIESIELATSSAQRQRELRMRLVPFIPSTIQFLYLGLLAIGAFGLTMARAWWRWIWPPEVRGEYRSRTGFYAAQFARLSIFVLVFLPLVAIPAAISAFLYALCQWMTWPWRLLRGANTRA